MVTGVAAPGSPVSEPERRLSENILTVADFVQTLNAEIDSLLGVPDDSSCIVESSAIQYAASDSECTALFTAAQLVGVSFCYRFQTTISPPTSGEDCEVNAAAQLVAAALIGGDFADAIGPAADIVELSVPTNSPTSAPTEGPTSLTFPPTSETFPPTSETGGTTFVPTSETEGPTSAPSSIPTPTAPERMDPLTNEEMELIPDLANIEGYTTFLEALDTANLIDLLLTPGPFTVFAPTNEAFDLLDDDLPGLFECLLEPRYAPYLQIIMTYHVAKGEVFLAEQLVNDQVIDMLDGQEVSINIDNDGTTIVEKVLNQHYWGAAVINSYSKIVQRNMLASNGIMHGIDHLLLPPNFNVERFYKEACLGTDSPTDEPTEANANARTASVNTCGNDGSPKSICTYRIQLRLPHRVIACIILISILLTHATNS